MTRQTLRIEELESQNKSLEERLSALEERMNGVDRDIGRAATSIGSIVRGTEHDFDLLKIEVNLLEEKVPILSCATFDVAHRGSVSRYRICRAKSVDVMRRASHR